nr:unnamed protein product [Callosobruchus analis]
MTTHGSGAPKQGKPHRVYNNWTHQILQAAEESIPKTKRYLGRNKYRPKPLWWDEECEKKLGIRRNAFHTYKQQSNRANFMKYKEIAAQTSVTKIRSTVRKFSNSQTSKLHGTEEEEHLADILNKLAQSDNPTNITDYTGNINNKSTFKNIELKEVKIIMKAKKDSAPGKDEISYLFLKNITKEHLQTLCDIIKAYHDGQLRGPRYTSKGLPQGSPLSPILFNIYLSRLDKLNPPEISVLQFADDILIISKSTNLNSCINNIQLTTNRIGDMLQELGLQISTHKTKGMIFSKGNIRYTPNPIQINNIPIEWVSNYKYLGIIFDSHMRWTNHIDNCVAKAAKGINIMKSLTRVWAGGQIQKHC